MFTYDELENYIDTFNAVSTEAAEVKYFMAGAFPDSSASVDLDAALRHAELLLANAEALRNEVRALAKAAS